MLLTQPDGSVSAPLESNATPAAPSHIEDALTSRLLQSAIHALELYSIYLGKELGLYIALQSGEWVTPAELAACRHRASLCTRVARAAGGRRLPRSRCPAGARRYAGLPPRGRARQCARH
jgi:hypothetical protein